MCNVSISYLPMDALIHAQDSIYKICSNASMKSSTIISDIVKNKLLFWTKKHLPRWESGIFYVLISPALQKAYWI